MGGGGVEHPAPGEEVLPPALAIWGDGGFNGEGGLASALALWGDGGLKDLGRGEGGVCLCLGHLGGGRVERIRQGRKGGFASALAIWGDGGLKAQFHVLHSLSKLVFRKL